MFLADENIDREIVERLRADGHDVLWVAELDRGLDDEAVLAMASKDGRALVTADKDFGELVFRQGRASAGVILIRLAGVAPQRKAITVSRTVAAHRTEVAGQSNHQRASRSGSRREGHDHGREAHPGLMVR
jgi:predicted nuclease of predicted toxin-antitoxin system